MLQKISKWKIFEEILKITALRVKSFALSKATISQRVFLLQVLIEMLFIKDEALTAVFHAGGTMCHVKARNEI